MPTDRAGELVTVSHPCEHVEVMSAVSSNRHWSDYHEGYVVALVDRDQPALAATWRLNSMTYVTSTGGFFLFSPGDHHRTIDVTAPARFSVVRFAPGMMQAACEQLDVPRHLHFDDPASRDPLAFDAVQQFVATVAAGADALSLECAQTEALASVITRLGRHSPSLRLDPVVDFRIRRVRDRLREQPEVRPSLDELAAMAQMTRFTLCRAFKNWLGMSPGQYWCGCRVSRARELLDRGASPTCVAHQLAFADEAHFSRIFRRNQGLPPKRWTKLHRLNARMSP
jgi:AraC-like DNA-binding protein